MKTIFLLIALGCIVFANAQQIEEAESGTWTVYGELGGAGVQFYTVDAEYLLWKVGRFNVHVRGGIGFGKFISHNWKINGEERYLNFLAIPVGLSAYNFVGSNHHVEFGFSVGYVNGTEISFNNIQNSTILLTPAFGYRFQKPSGGLIFKLLYTPNIPLHEFNERHFYTDYGKNFRQGIGICVGYAFKKRA